MPSGSSTPPSGSMPRGRKTHERRRNDFGSARGPREWRGRPAQAADASRDRISRLRLCHPRRGDELDFGATFGLRHLQRRRLRGDRVRGDDPRSARYRDCRDQKAHHAAVRGQPHHHAPDAERVDRRLREASGDPRRARRRASAGRGDRPDQGQWRQIDRLRPRAGPRQEAHPIGRRRAGDRGDGGGRAHRSGLDQRAGAGNPPRGGQGHSGVRRRRDRARRGDCRLSRDGGGRGPARHALRLRDRVHRPCQFQEGVPARQCPRRHPLGPDRPAPAGDPGTRAQES